MSTQLDSIDRIYKRALHIEADISVLLTELANLKAQMNSFEVIDVQGNELDFGFKKIFVPGSFIPSQPLQAYQIYANCLLFSYDTQNENKPILDAWHSKAPLNSNDAYEKHSLNVFLKKKMQHNWVLMELLLDWGILEETPHIIIAVTARASTPVTVPICIYTDRLDGGALRFGDSQLIIGEDLHVHTAEFNFGDTFYAEANKTVPAKLHFSLDQAESSRIEFVDVRIFALDPIQLA